MSEIGLEIFAGAPGTGKTTAALEAADAAAARLGWPLVIVDSASCIRHRAPLIANDGLAPRDVARRIVIRACSERGSLRWTPRSKEELELSLGALAAARLGVVLLVDEFSFWIDSRRRGSPTLLRLFRTWRHEAFRIFATTQHLSGDVPAEVRSCAPRWNLFRCPEPAVRELAVRLGLSDGQAIELKDLPTGGRFVLEPGQPASYVKPRRGARATRRLRS